MAASADYLAALMPDLPPDHTPDPAATPPHLPAPLPQTTRAAISDWLTEATEHGDAQSFEGRKETVRHRLVLYVCSLRGRPPLPSRRPRAPWRPVWPGTPVVAKRQLLTARAM